MEVSLAARKTIRSLTAAQAFVKPESRHAPTEYGNKIARVWLSLKMRSVEMGKTTTVMGKQTKVTLDASAPLAKHKSATPAESEQKVKVFAVLEHKLANRTKHGTFAKELSLRKRRLVTGKITIVTAESMIFLTWVKPAQKRLAKVYVKLVCGRVLAIKKCANKHYNQQQRLVTGKITTAMGKLMKVC